MAYLYWGWVEMVNLQPIDQQEPIKALACEVIRRALEDLMIDSQKESAKNFLEVNNPLLDFWAGLAGFEANAIASSTIIKKLKEEI